MKALITDREKIIGWRLVDFKPLADDWLSWESQNKEIKLIHEKCYYKLALGHSSKLERDAPQGVCTLCGVEAPPRIKQFVLLANGVRLYGDGHESEK